MMTLSVARALWRVTTTDTWQSASPNSTGVWKPGIAKKVLEPWRGKSVVLNQTVKGKKNNVKCMAMRKASVATIARLAVVPLTHATWAHLSPPTWPCLQRHQSGAPNESVPHFICSPAEFLLAGKIFRSIFSPGNFHWIITIFALADLSRSERDWIEKNPGTYTKQ